MKMGGKTTYPPFKKMRFIVESPDHSKLIQEALFKLGYKWPVEGATLAHFDKPCLLGDNDGDVLYSDYTVRGTSWESGTSENLQTMIKEMEKPHMTTLKTNWAIRTTDEQFKAYIGTLEALGYPIFNNTKKEVTKQGGMDKCEHIGMYGYHVPEVCRLMVDREVVFPDISSFLVYHFSSEKTEAKKELEALQEKMNSLQEQIDRVKLSITK